MRAAPTISAALSLLLAAACTPADEPALEGAPTAGVLMELAPILLL